MKNFLLLFTGIFTCTLAFNQSSTWENVYSIIQTNCSGCHVAGHVSGLDMSGTISETYDVLYDVVPTNIVSADKHYKRVTPGNPYKSFIFNKINNGLALDVNLVTGEGEACPQGASPLDEKEIELIRQWILYGAFETGTLVDETLIADFYDNDGIQSVPSPPSAPPVGEGYQIHYGPFFLWPEEEHEYWYKLETDESDTIEVNRLDTYMGEYSHHFIMYKYYNTAIASSVEYGIHDGPDFNGVELVYGHQFSDSLKLPNKTAFSWANTTILNLNTHYINYSSDKSLACEVYINVFTQEKGTAAQIMYTTRKSNSDLDIPNDSLPHTFIDTSFGFGHGEDQMFVWAMTSHTHKYGADFDIFKRTEAGDKGEQIFDASCGATNGAPGCLDEIYDYHHPPTRKWPVMIPVRWMDGFIYEATFINDGPVPVHFGMTAEDEMAVFMYFYVDDTTGLNLSEEETAIENILTPTFSVFPNPADNTIFIHANETLNDILISISDITGKVIIEDQQNLSGSTSNYLSLDVSGLPPGMYILQGKENGICRFNAKIVIK